MPNKITMYKVIPDDGEIVNEIHVLVTEKYALAEKHYFNLQDMGYERVKLVKLNYGNDKDLLCETPSNTEVVMSTFQESEVIEPDEPQARNVVYTNQEKEDQDLDAAPRKEGEECAGDSSD